MADAAVLEREELDSRIVAGSIRRFTLDMIDPWLLRRLDKRWPGKPEYYWRNKLNGFLQSNDYLIVCNDRAILLAERKPHAITGVPEVGVIFCWSRDTAPGEWLDQDKVQPMIDLYAYCRRWLTDMNGDHMLCAVSDDLRSDTVERYMLHMRNADGGRAIIMRPYKGRGR